MLTCTWVGGYFCLFISRLAPHTNRCTHNDHANRGTTSRRRLSGSRRKPLSILLMELNFNFERVHPATDSRHVSPPVEYVTSGGKSRDCYESSLTMRRRTRRHMSRRLPPLLSVHCMLP
ncbi:unnamed protein product [Parnassius apollo]|uniref:(apollo) hypothetical protein n=1 Tax=Parnassius apollo TaxID=110799 RepID=A0A8S3XYL6_PARAO|nr:unnamed protein product [Parnassius apollo]